MVVAWKKSYLTEVEKLSLEIENEFMKEDSLLDNLKNSEIVKTELLSIQNNLEMLIESKDRLFDAAKGKFLFYFHFLGLLFSHFLI